MGRCNSERMLPVRAVLFKSFKYQSTYLFFALTSSISVSSHSNLSLCVSVSFFSPTSALSKFIQMFPCLEICETNANVGLAQGQGAERIMITFFGTVPLLRQYMNQAPFSLLLGRKQNSHPDNQRHSCRNENLQHPHHL